MLITKEQIDDTIVIHCEGRLDATTTIKLENAINQLIDSKKIRVIVDFNKVDYLSSAGMRLLLSMTKRLKTLNGQLVLCGIHDDVMEIIKMAGFEQILNIYYSQDEAVRICGN